MVREYSLLWDLLRCLRNLADGEHDDLSVARDAAEEIERLDAENDELRAKVERVEKLAQFYIDEEDNRQTTVTVAEEIRAALEGRKYGT